MAVVPSAHAAFPGRNGEIAFARATLGVGSAVYFIQPDGTGLRKLTPTAALEGAPAWSPDGTKLALVTSFGFGIDIANPDGSGSVGVPNLPSGDNWDPGWSPDGNRIVFNNQAGSHPPVDTIYTIGTDGSDRIALGHGRQPAWSPDGTKIAHVDWSLIGQFEIAANVAVMDSDGSNDAILTSDGLSDAPNWSPDGTKIAFTSARDGRPEVYSMNADGSSPQRLTSSAPGSGSPAWSPDGTQIVFVSGRDGSGADLYVMNADGTGETRITSDPAHELEPDWQPLPGPRREDYKNAAKFCKAERDHIGDSAFTAKYGGGRNAFGNCVSRNG